MSLFVSFLIVFVALLASLTVYWQGVSDIYLRLFPPFLFVVAVVAAILGYLASHDKNNMLLFNPLTVFQCCFYFFILYRIIRNPLVRNIAKHLIWIYPLVAGFNIIYIQTVRAFHSVTYSLGGLTVVALCVFYFFELFQRPQVVSLGRNPDFWICSGLLFYFACSFPIYGMANNLNSVPLFIRMNLNAIFNVLDILLYTSFVVAFLCRPRIRKSS
jgi:hypothetical protein